MTDNVQALVVECKKEVEGSSPNAAKASQLLTQLKIAMTKFGQNPADQTKETFLGREILELACMFAVKSRDDKSFERHFAQLRPYYYDYSSVLPESARRQPILGLYLLHLLTEGRIGDFHTELELIPEKEHSEMYIKFSVELERDIMEGRYNKVFLSKSNAPAETFLFFVEKLMGAVRSEVADCIEASYEKLSTVEAAKILMFPAANTDFDSFVDSRGWMGDGSDIFLKSDAGTKHEIAAHALINHTLSYAHEIERII